MNVETFCGFLERIVFVHGDDVLKTELFRRFRSDFQGADDLTAVHAIEEMAVVDEEAGADPRLAQRRMSIMSKQKICMFLMPLLREPCIGNWNDGPVGGLAPRSCCRRIRIGAWRFPRRRGWPRRGVPLCSEKSRRRRRVKAVSLDLQFVLGAFELFGGGEALAQ